MALDVLQNYAEATVTTSLNNTDAAGTSDTVTVSALNGSWVGLATGQQMRVADKTDVNNGTGYEIMILTANNSGATGSWTVTRGAEGSTVKAHTANWTLVPVETAGGLNGRFVAAMAPMPVVGEWIGSQAAIGNQQSAVGSNTFAPLLLSGAATFDQIGWNVDSAGSTGALIRLGVYTSDANGRPAGLVVDAGTVNATVTGLFQITFGTPQQLGPGLYWLYQVVQGAPSTVPASRFSGGNTAGMNINSSQNDTTAPQSAFQMATAPTGSLAATATASGALAENFNAFIPLIVLHRSA